MMIWDHIATVVGYVFVSRTCQALLDLLVLLAVLDVEQFHVVWIFDRGFHFGFELPECGLLFRLHERVHPEHRVGDREDTTERDRGNRHLDDRTRRRVRRDVDLREDDRRVGLQEPRSNTAVKM